jgi:hypothetical protein
MSVTFAPPWRKGRKANEAHITVNLVPLLTTVDDNVTDCQLQFGPPDKNQIGPRSSYPLPLVWDVGSTFLVIGELIDIELTDTHLVGEGVIKPGSCSQVALDDLRNPGKPVWACPDVGWIERDNVTIDSRGVQLITGWTLRSVTLTTNIQRTTWPYQITPITMQVNTTAVRVSR